MNNPLKYTDPTGNTWWSHFTGWLDEHNIGETLLGYAHPHAGPAMIIGALTRNEWDLTKRGTTFNNNSRIFLGLFETDTKQAGWGWQIVSRFTWEGIQTSMGYTAAEFTNLFKDVKAVDYWRGATTVQTRGQWGGITLGSYIIGDEDLEANPFTPLFQHEYGHLLQSRASGWSYIPRFGIPSLFDRYNGTKYQDHHKNPVEIDANARALLYFTKNVNGFTYDSWDFGAHEFYDADGNLLNAGDISIGFLQSQLLIPTYIQELIINHLKNSSRNNYSGY